MSEPIDWSRCLQRVGRLEGFDLFGDEIFLAGLGEDEEFLNALRGLSHGFQTSRPLALHLNGARPPMTAQRLAPVRVADNDSDHAVQ